MNPATQYTLFISNGHGEDVCGAAIASCLRKIAPHREIRAFPFIDNGEAYLKQGIPVIGPHYNLPFGGHIYGRPIPILVDTIYGLPLLLQQIRFLKQIAPQVSEVVAVGDIVPLVLNRYFIKKPLYYLAISKSAYYENGRMPILVPGELKAFKSHGRTIFFRDKFTWERARVQCPELDLKFFGNPMMDTLKIEGQGFPGLNHPVIGILPGSRKTTYRYLTLLTKVMAAIIEQIPEASFIISQAPQIDRSKMEAILDSAGWRRNREAVEADSCFSYTKKPAGKAVLTGRFGDILLASDILIGLTGTGNEQAVGLGKPVINFPVNYTTFAWVLVDAQARLLGKSLVPVKSHDPRRIAVETIHTLHLPDSQRQIMAADGIERMGNGPGASERIARYIAEVDTNNP